MRGERIAGLDNWRALLMLAGIFLHATNVQEANLPLFALIANTSANFRMGSFFAVAGLLSLFAIRKRGADAWLARRSFQIGIPTIFGLFVLAPLMSALHTWHWLGTMMPALPTLGWWHYWFLVGLLAYAPLTWWIYRVDQAHGLFARLDQWVAARRPSATLIILMVGVAATMCVELLVFLVPFTGSLAHPIWATHLIVAYAPLYMFGITLAGSPALLHCVTGRTGPAFTVLAILFSLCLATRLLPGGGAALFETAASPVNVIVSCVCPPAVTVLILRSALAMREVPLIFRRISDASFTIYMVHFPIILALDIVIDRLQLHPYLAYLLTIGLAGWLSYLMHRLVVRRSAFAAMLLNGINPASARAAVTE